MQQHPFVQDTGQGFLLWMFRSALVAGGTWLTQRGYTDAATWQTISGGLIAATGLGLSFIARQRALATEPRR